MSETSLIPSVIALSRFFAENFPNFDWYPYWYLGNPFRFLIGPVVPVILAFFSKLLPFPFLNIYLGFMFFSYFLTVFGTYFFCKEWNKNRKFSLLTAFLFLSMPFSLFLLKYQNGLNIVAFSVIPFLLLFIKRFLEKEGTVNILFSFTLLSLVFLINVFSVLTALIGILALFGVIEFGKIGKERVIKLVLIFLASLFLSTVWYTPQFWLVLGSNPSTGGIPLFNLSASVFKFLLSFVPLLILLTGIMFKRHKAKDLSMFGYLFFASFLFLSLVRFVFDPDFVMDWTAYGIELQFSAGILLSLFIYHFKKTNQKFTLSVALFIIAISTSLAAIPPVFNRNVHFQNTVEILLKEKKERVFLSGSPVFWLNEENNFPQVRGGFDSGAIHPFWSHASFYIREGKDTELTSAWLSVLGSPFIVVHSEKSSEPFKDFKNMERFKAFKKEQTMDKETLYSTSAYFARTADKEILKMGKPKNGADLGVILSYSRKIKKPLFSEIEKDKIFIKGDLLKDEVISLAVPYSKNFKAIKGSGIITGDSFGNLVFIPKKTGEQDIIVSYKQPFLGSLAAFLISLLFLISVFFYNKILRGYIEKIKLNFGAFEEDEY